MKNILFSILVCLSSQIFGQSFLGNEINKQITWILSIEKIDDSHAILVFTGKLKNNLHIFSLNHDPSKAQGTGMVPEITLKKSNSYLILGKPYETLTPLKHVDDLGTSLYFEKKVVFKQKIEIKSSKTFLIHSTLYYQLCEDEGSCFLPEEKEFEFKIAGFEVDAQKEIIGLKKYNDLKNNKLSDKINSDSHCCCCCCCCCCVEGNTSFTKENKLDSNYLKKGTFDSLGDKENRSLWLLFVAGFLAGLVALITPCMFPMIPMTVSFFTGQSKNRREGIFKAIIYGVSIVVIYVGFGLLITGIMGPLGLNDLSTNIWMNLIFFGVFAFFAFSFLGAYDIQLPNSWVNKMDRLADKGGYLGIFFMAFTLGLVSFSCTGPIIGTLLVEASTSGSYLAPAIGMIGFSLALAIPFTFFAVFPGWLNSLPQSGGWLNSVKVVLGLAELALALKFLSSVDLAYHWDLLTREWFIAIWFVLFLIIGLYLLGKIRFSHDSPVDKLGVPRFMFALLALTFSVYLFTGMFGAPLTLIDGIAPPRTHSEDNFRWVNGGLETGLGRDSISIQYASEMHSVGDGSILVFHDLAIGKEYAKKKNLPILLDFTGYACQNCRKMESSVWTNDEIRPLLQKQFVIISLYVDDRTPLPANEVRFSKSNGNIKTFGNKWADLEINKYRSSQQPLYIVTDSEGNDLTSPSGYTPNANEFKSFLMKGVNNFKNKKNSRDSMQTIKQLVPKKCCCCCN